MHFTGHNCVTPSQAVTALEANGGRFNCTAKLVTLKRDWLQQIETELSALDAKFKKNSRSS